MRITPPRPVEIIVSETELRELYRILDIREKLARGQVFSEARRTMSAPRTGNFPLGTRSLMFTIWLTVNDWLLCIAHQYVNADGSDYTGPDPKWIRVDDVIFQQGKIV